MRLLSRLKLLRLSLPSFGILCACGVGILVPGPACGQLLVGDANGVIAEYTPSGQLIRSPFISITGLPVSTVYDGAGNIFVSTYGETGRIGVYGLSGAAKNASLINNVYYGYALALDGNQLFVASDPARSIALYSTSGTLLNSQLISLPFSPYSLAADGNGHLYVGGGGGISLYTTSGQLLNASLVSGLSNPYSIALDGQGYMYVADAARGVVGKYTTAGQTINAELISTGPYAPDCVVLDKQGHLYVSTAWNQTVGLFTTDGVPLNRSLITTPANPLSLVLIPEPSSLALWIVGSALLFACCRPKRQAEYPTNR